MRINNDKWKVRKAPKPLEKVDERATVKWARDRGILVTKLNLMGHSGFPDQCFWVAGGKPLLIEFKRQGESPTALQTKTHDDLRRLGYNVQVCDNKEDAKRLLSQALGAERSPEAGRAVPTKPRLRRTAP